MICTRCLAGDALAWLLGCLQGRVTLPWEVGERQRANCKLVVPKRESPHEGTGRWLLGLTKSNFCLPGLLLCSDLKARLAFHSQAGLCWPPQCGEVSVGCLISAYYI